jgi:general secretion pathway protein G
MQPRRKHLSSSAGMTMLELIIATGILIVLASAAMPLARLKVKRDREAELRYDLREMRDAIDRYKDAADKGLIRVEVGTEGYPPDLETLVNGVQVAANTIGAANPTTSTTQSQQKVRFLRKIFVDPMTGRAEWGLRAVQDDPTSTSWGGKNVFDVYSLSQGTAMDDSKYADW